MKLSNTEKDFKNKLNERSIQPSENAWNILAEKLTTAEKNNPKRRFNWLYLAATITGITFIGIYMMVQKNNEVINDPILVVQENIVQADSLKSNDRSEKEIFKNPISTLKSSSEFAEIKENKSEKSNKTVIAEVENTSLIDNIIQEKNALQMKPINIDAQEFLIAIENSGELKMEKTSIKIDASSLLSQVNNELEQTFKEKALQSINKNFNNLKTALATRNIDN